LGSPGAGAGITVAVGGAAGGLASGAAGLLAIVCGFILGFAAGLVAGAWRAGGVSESCAAARVASTSEMAIIDIGRQIFISEC